MSANRQIENSIENQNVSETEYLAQLEKSEIKLEYICGYVRAMADASSNHARISNRVAQAINARLPSDSTCEAVTSDIKVGIESEITNYFPDVVFYCDDATFVENRPDWLLTPLLIAEVSSDSTANIDRTEKLFNYRQIPSLCHYLLVSQRRVFIEHFHRNDQNQWIYDSYGWNRDEIFIDFLDISIPVSEIYRRLNIPEGMVVIEETETD
ncbi:Endonuclease, Uma2 family (restriction endonuclease fold) [Abditibacterium utsteinense]|uniref:Endonuclease, Uma2 family (Restriction endonuclease fold) n=1 Tax=Abditibacterium utsteinense TaxID=1960156 RepID=A0A2S8ST94_9BACT|nr:Uma2 family endonuclease [Abditibacterium utsteinense]PQV64021.1 Endonuclease, Uma2 family (restriction endonuclease fold) [Abditibacterium utsteinense]